MRIIQSKKDKLGTYEIAEISLSCFDDKRYVFQMIEFILRVIFIKIVSQVAIVKKIVIIEKDGDY